MKKMSTIPDYKFSLFLLTLALVVGGIGAQASGILNTPAGGYLVCVNSSTKVVTYPGTSKCPKGSKKLLLGAQGAAGIDGVTGAAGLPGKDGVDGKDGNTVWNGTKDPEVTLGVPGDMFINTLTNTLFGPKDVESGWPSRLSMVGPARLAGGRGPTGAQVQQSCGKQCNTDLCSRWHLCNWRYRPRGWKSIYGSNSNSCCALAIHGSGTEYVERWYRRSSSCFLQCN